MPSSVVIPGKQQPAAVVTVGANLDNPTAQPAIARISATATGHALPPE
ncbi:hypothetical protein [Erwinia amylovora]|uniref:Uncharacterized protein n=1 Tax=Erwinia amylovora TaxID=552 RepID=A0ABX7MGB5_ERWAM|nr:hypothetical protein [Erwinia amylovora]MBZ2389785.1 hypothetical protein [Erwinia amylovora]MBZ2396222.1 hypothetical protein [Erwinia amylovora]MBZ2398477.1 hypothetical protein [Erwinia amylovora]MBZ2402366.1 hypothetical protein [Erwinia amylovora]MCK8156144.1 hypothetical protein [Erwinia amylovora]